MINILFTILGTTFELCYWNNAVLDFLTFLINKQLIFEKKLFCCRFVKMETGDKACFEISLSDTRVSRTAPVLKLSALKLFMNITKICNKSNRDFVFFSL